MQTPEIRETIRHYLVLRAVSKFGMAFTNAYYVTFLMARGLNLLEVNLVNFSFFTTLFLCEIPTGAFADVFGRKRSYVLSCALVAAGMVTYGCATSFWGYVAAEVIIGIGLTFASGAFRAWLVDRLHHQGYRDSLTDIFAREEQMAGGIGILAPILGVYLATFGVALPWHAGGIMMAIASILAARYMREEDEFVKTTVSLRGGYLRMRDIAVQSAQYSRTNTAVRFILAMSILQTFAVQALNMQWQPFFRSLTVSTTSLGYIFASMSIALMVGSGYARRFLRFFGSERTALLAAQALTGISILATVATSTFGIVLAAFLMHEIGRGIINPLRDVYLNDNIPPQERATIISFAALASHIGGMAGLLASGVIANYTTITTAWNVSGVMMVCSALILWKMQKA
ncbi:MAG: MFS transporter [Candidatus Pacebacteria bacterium]|nr:MFS transporter [Candidatus Paceibacterota bacterium]